MQSHKVRVSGWKKEQLQSWLYGWPGIVGDYVKELQIVQCLGRVGDSLQGFERGVIAMS